MLNFHWQPQKSHPLSTQKWAQARPPWSRASRCLQAVYLPLRGTKPKLINCSWLHTELARVSAPWFLSPLQRESAAVRPPGSSTVSQPTGGRARAEEKVTNPTPERHLGMSAEFFGLPLPSTAQLPGPLVKEGRTVRTRSPALEAATHPTYRCTVTALHRFRARVQHFMACTIFHWSVIKRLQLGQ